MVNCKIPTCIKDPVRLMEHPNNSKCGLRNINFKWYNNGIQKLGASTTSTHLTLQAINYLAMVNLLSFLMTYL